jgi:hypothetical protein
MKTNVLKYLALAGKVTGVVAGLGAIPFVSPQVGVLIFAVASIVKDVTNRVGDILDDGQANGSFKSE